RPTFRTVQAVSRHPRYTQFLCSRTPARPDTLHRGPAYRCLESTLGCPVFSRSTHAIKPTTAGLVFAERARRIVQELQLARAEVTSLQIAPRGRIRIDAPAPFGRRHLAPALAEFLSIYP